MSDDHAAHGISAYGGRLAKIAPTPNLDRLAQEGALSPECLLHQLHLLAFRACVLTGQYNHAQWGRGFGRSSRTRQANARHRNEKGGIESAMIGKWHLKVEPKDFDHCCVLPGQGKYHGPPFRIDKPWGQNLIEFPNKHSTDAIADLTLNG